MCTRESTQQNVGSVSCLWAVWECCSCAHVYRRVAAEGVFTAWQSVALAHLAVIVVSLPDRKAVPRAHFSACGLWEHGCNRPPGSGSFCTGGPMLPVSLCCGVVRTRSVITGRCVVKLWEVTSRALKSVFGPLVIGRSPSRSSAYRCREINSTQVSRRGKMVRHLILIWRPWNVYVRCRLYFYMCVLSEVGSVVNRSDEMRTRSLTCWGCNMKVAIITMKVMQTITKKSTA